MAVNHLDANGSTNKIDTERSIAPPNESLFEHTAGDNQLFDYEESSHDNHSRSHSSTSFGEHSGHESVQQHLPKVATNETRKLSYIKLAVVFVLMVSTVLISWTIYRTTKDGEINQFEAQFEDQGDRLVKEFRLLFLGTLGAIDNFGVTITSHVRSMNLVFPFAFVPEFDIRAASTSSLAKVPFLAFVPKVDNNDLEMFNNYTVDLSFWVDQALARQYGHPSPPTPAGQMMHHRRRDLQMEDMEDMEMNMEGMINSNNTSSNSNTNMQDGMDLDHGDDYTGMVHGEMMDSTHTHQDTTTEDHSGHDMGGHSGHDMDNDAEYHYQDIFPGIYSFDQDGTTRIAGSDKEVYWPIFQCQPVEPDIVNLDLLSHPVFGSELQTSFDSVEIVVGRLVFREKKVEQAHAQTDGHDNDTMEMHHDHDDQEHHAEMNHPEDTHMDMDMDMDHSGHDDMTGGMDHDGHRQRKYRHLTDHHVLDPLEQFIYAQAEPQDGPFSQIVFPVFSGFETDRTISGFLTISVFWSQFLTDNLPETVENVICVLENQCGQVVSYEINTEQQAAYLGQGDFHDPAFDHLEVSMSLAEMVRGEGGDQTELTYSKVFLQEEYCPFTLHVYPSEQMQDNYTTKKPTLYLLLVIGTFLITSLTILGYDRLHEKRNRAVIENARQTNLIVSSLFPAIVRDRLFGTDSSTKGIARKTLATPSNQLRNFLDAGQAIDKSQAIADLFPYTTVLFADIAGFTAWSSLREPSQVFTLLETLYGEFDAMAKKRHVFKVETIGDCYVAVTGLPNPQEEHAVIMASFANESLKRFGRVTQKLGISLGPDTSDLSIRIGLNSGPVTAGVLRGEKSRFQLFGDTVNTAARMESTGQVGRIQCSQATADLLTNAGKSEWLSVRQESVDVKGKGFVKTFWIDVDGKDDNSSGVLAVDEEKDEYNNGTSERLMLLQLKSATHGVGTLKGDKLSQNKRLIEWHVELLSKLLKQIIAHRSRRDRGAENLKVAGIDASCKREITTPLDELQEIIVMPKFDAKKAKKFVDPDSIVLPSNITSQLQDYITTLSCMYHNNPFHNFNHASHVTMAANKLLSRIVAPDQVLSKQRSTKTLALNLHDYTFGLTSDPLTQFAVVFSALIHDADHRGVSNGQLVKEKTDAAIKYSGHSVAEQNSVDLAWEMLMDPSLEELRGCIYSNESEFERFRQLVVNSVIATDIFDKDLKELRNKRWADAFYREDDAWMDNPDEDFNRKATIVIEHIIQAADVSHTMQHWHVYQKWNERLFEEMYLAYKAGRGGVKDPSEGWYKGELWFYDNYVIPLAKKLKECGVFGVSSAECLNYAVQNRQEWEKKGEGIVAKFKRKYSGEEAEKEGSSHNNRR